MKRKYRWWTTSEDRFVREMCHCMGVGEIADGLGRSRETVWHYMNYNNIPMRLKCKPKKEIPLCAIDWIIEGRKPKHIRERFGLSDSHQRKLRIELGVKIK